jgi:hypothetical protein
MVAVYRPSPEVILTELGDGTAVLLHLGTKFYFTLNATGIAAWKALGQGASAASIADHLARHFRIDTETAARDLDPMLNEMLAERLIALAP